MRWGLDILLGLVGVVLGLISVAGWLSGWEGMVVGLLVALVIALILGQYAGGKYFWNGFVVGVVSSLLSSLMILLQYDTYFEHFTQTDQFKQAMDKLAQAGKGTEDMKSMMHTTTMIGMPFGIAIGGAVQGLFAWLAGKVFGKKPVPVVTTEPESLPAEESPNDTGTPTA